MSKEKKKLYLSMLFGYLGLFLLLIAGVRYIFITEDIAGRSLMTFAIICLGTFSRYVESQLLTTNKEKIVFQSILILGIIIIFIIVLFLSKK